MPQVTDHDRLQFYSACRCYRERNEPTPSSTKTNTITWNDWFAKHWGETLNAYFARAKAENLVERIVQYERAVYGDSPAAQRAADVRELMRAARARKLKR